MTGILGQLKWESLKKRRKDNKDIRLILLYKGHKGKASVPTDDLSPKLGVVGISTLWHFRLPLPIQTFIKVVSSPRLSGIGMPSPILWSHPLKMQRIVLLSSLLWWELGTNSLITGPGEWLLFRRFTSKLSWSWASSWDYGTYHIGDQRRLRRDCRRDGACAQSRQSLRCSHNWSMVWPNIRHLAPLEGCACTQHGWRMRLRRTKRAIISWNGSFCVCWTVIHVSNTQYIILVKIKTV